MRISVSLAAACVLMAFSLPAKAEGDFVALGVGLNLAKFRLDFPSGYTEPDQSNRVAPAFQMGYQSGNFNGNATVLSLSYEGKGAVWSAPGANDDVTIKFDYLQLGFQYKILFGQTDGGRFYLAPGFGAGFLVQSEASAGSDSEDLKDVTPFDLELTGALGAQIPAGKNSFFIEGGYGFGLLDTDDSEEASINNSVIKLRIGLLIGA